MKPNKIINVCIMFFLIAIISLSLVTAKAILNKPSEWYAGDQHVHSELNKFVKGSEIK